MDACKTLANKLANIERLVNVTSSKPDVSSPASARFASCSRRDAQYGFYQPIPIIFHMFVSVFVISS